MEGNILQRAKQQSVYMPPYISSTMKKNFLCPPGKVFDFS